MADARLALTTGMPILYGGDKFAFAPEHIAQAFQAGDRLLVVEESGELLHIPAAASEIAASAVGRAREAFAAMDQVADEAISHFFAAFASRLEDADTWAALAAANEEDLASASARNRSTTRLTLDWAMRAEVIAGLRVWRDLEHTRGRLIERVDHRGWSVEQTTAAVGVVGFVFEGRPNVVADAAGVLRGGNTAVLRIGGDALRTARAIMRHALAPALEDAGLPPGAVSLVDSAEHAAAWALMADHRLSLAVARGSGPAVSQLGAIARQAGTPVSLHGGGGAWLIADTSASADRFEAAVGASLDRKACNTMNVCCIVGERAAELVPLFLAALERAGAARGGGVRLHIGEGDETWLPRRWLTERVVVRRADGEHDEPLADTIAVHDLGREWEWEETPEVSLKIVADLDDAIALFNARSPRFIACLIAEDAHVQERFFRAVEAPFVGDGFTRWVDGQYALERPELGLSNWLRGRLFARGAVLSGDGVFTVRTRMRQNKAGLKR
ncbi:MAG TPA: aldehyde dehydrogenase family protein [Caulobacteraceae bacterium]